MQQETARLNGVGTRAILARLWYFANAPRHPLVRLELRLSPQRLALPPTLRRVYRRVIQIAFALALFGFIWDVLRLSRFSFLMMTFMLTLPLLGVLIAAGVAVWIVLWSVPVALAAGSSLVRERNGETWELLLMTPLPRQDLLLARLAVGLARQQSFLTLITLLQCLPLFHFLGQVNNALRIGSGIVPLVMTLFSASLFIVERLQSFVICGLLGLVSALNADTWSLATAGAALLALLAAVARTLFTYLAALLLAQGRVPDFIPVLLVGLPMLAPDSRNIWVGIAVFCGALVAQELAIRALLRWLVYHASFR